MDALKARYRPEFLNRLDEMVLSHPLDPYLNPYPYPYPHPDPHP